jgi:RNA polymerase sigma factor (sigma-70 family)
MFRIESEKQVEYKSREPLTNEEEHYHAYRAQYYNDKESERTLIEANVRWAKIFTQQFCENRGVKGFTDELLCAAVLGLYDTVYAYDPTRGTRFGSYANSKMLNRLNIALDVLLNESAPKIPRNTTSLYVELKREQDRLEQVHQRTVSLDDAIESLDLTDEWRHVMVDRFNSQMVPFSKRLSAYDTDTVNFEELIASPQPDIDDQINAAQCAEMIDAELTHVPAQAMFILEQNIGSGLSAGSTLESIGDSMSITRERVRQIRNDAKQQLYRRHNQKKGNEL